MRFIRHPLTWLGLLLTVVALYLVLRGIEWATVGDAIVEADYALLGLGVLVLVGALYTRALRWQALFVPRRDLRIWHLLGALNIGYAVNNLLPLRVGEFARAYVICRRESVESGRAVSTIVVERTLDTITVVALLVVTLPFIDAPGWARGPALLLGLAFLGIAGILAAASAQQERAMRVVRRLDAHLPERFRPPLEVFAETALEGFAVVRRPAVMARAAFWSLVSWLLSAVVMYISMRAFGLDVTFTAGLFIMSATSLGGVVPSTPGYVGVFHGIAIPSLIKVFGVERADATAFAFVQHAMLYLTPIAMALVYLATERDTWRDIRQWTGRAASTDGELVPGAKT